MAEAVKIRLDKRIYYNLLSYRSSSAERGQAVEMLVKEFLEMQEINFNEITDKVQQLQSGDLMLTDINKSVEIKTSHQWNDIDKLAFDIYYFKGYNKRTNELIPYLQSNTGSNLGWIYNCNADYLFAFNVKSSKLYIIKEFQKLKSQVIQAVEMYIDDIGLRNWYLNGKNNRINNFVEGAVNYNDRFKFSLIANLELSQSSLNYFNVDYDIIDIRVTEKRRIRQ